MAEKFTHLPDECWELILSFILPQFHDHDFESLSLVCKQLLSITNKLRSHLRISELTVPVLPQIFSRFRHLKHIDLQHFNGDLVLLLRQIADSGLNLESLDISHQKTISDDCGVLGFMMSNLKSLVCSWIDDFPDKDLVLIPDSFPNLEELDISYPMHIINPNHKGITDSGILAITEKLPRLRKVNLSGHPFITDKALLALATKCVWLKEISICGCQFITQVGIAAALSQSPNLISISANGIGSPFFYPSLVSSLVSLRDLSCLDLSESNVPDEVLHSLARASLSLKKLVLSRCNQFSSSGILLLLQNNQQIEWLDLEMAFFLTDQSVRELSEFLPVLKFVNFSFCSRLSCSSLFTLARNCPSLNQIKMVNVNLVEEEDNSIDFVNPQVAFMELSDNENLCNASLSKLASIFPNLEKLKLNQCVGITKEAIGEVLRKCTKIRHLEVNHCHGIKNLVMDFELPAMEVLVLEGLRIGDEALATIGRRCPCLISLDLRNCTKVSAKGVKKIVRSCRGLRQINLRCCDEVDGNVIPWMVFSRFSLREIFPPESFIPTESQRQLFLRHGCVVHYDAY